MKFNFFSWSKMNRQDSTLVLFFHAISKEKSQTSKSHKKTESLFCTSDIPESLQQLIKSSVEEGSFSAQAKETLFFRSCQREGIKNVLLVGLGNKENKSTETFRVAGGVALNHLRSAKIRQFIIHIPSLLNSTQDSQEYFSAFCEGILLANYTYDDLKLLNDPKKKAEGFKVDEIQFLMGEKNKPSVWAKALEEAQILTDCINFSRKLADTPGNLMTPEILAQETVKAAHNTGIKVTIWNKEKIKKEKMGGLWGVSLGSAVDPRFIILNYQGGKSSQKPVVFVGKGLTFDSGGISIKPSAQMDEMKYDMCGGANVIGTLLALARLKLKVNAMGLIPATENMPGPLANKPGDVLTFRNGKTAEILNTDAEGRLILADALAYASEQNPAAIFDAATLTGAIVVALSNIYTGFFTRDSKLRKKIEEVAQTAGERLWPLPLDDFHFEDIKGTAADISNISQFKGGGSSTAAAFLEQFVDPNIPWAHFDIAGTAWACGNRLPYCPAKGATGVMIRTFIELAKNYF